MIRNLKALGLALVAAFALSALGVTAAQATPNEVEGEIGAAGSVTLTGEQVAGPEHPDHTFTLSSGRQLTCNVAQFEGTAEDGDTELTLTPTYSNCFSNGTQPVTVRMNGCDYLFRGGTPKGTHEFTGGTANLVCPAGKVVEIDVYSSEANHKAGTPLLCRYTVAAFVNNSANTYTNVTGHIHHLTVTTTASAVPTKRVSGTSLVCGAENQTSVYTGSTTVRAYSGSPHVNGTAPTGNQIPLTLVAIP